MTCEDIRFKAAGAGPGGDDPDVQSHLAQCAECRAFAARDLAVRRLMALKRHELPDRYAETRLIARVREAVAGTTPGVARLPDALRGWLPPALRWAAAAAAAAVAVLTLLYPLDEPVAPGPFLVTQPAEELNFVGPLDLDHRPPVTAFVDPFMTANQTNPSPPALRLKAASGSDYSGGRLLPVSFEY